MKVEIHINGSNQLQLTPETAIESAVLSDMLTAAGKGKSVSLQPMTITGIHSQGAVVSVEK